MNAVTMNQDRYREEPLGALGMWVFIATEVLFFGALCAGFMVYRLAYGESFSAASQRLDLVLGTVNTAVLLTSSLTMALAVLAARLKRTGATLLALGGTAVLGVSFLAIKGIEYYEEFKEHLMPWQPDANFSMGQGKPSHAQLFFDFYFAMTGLHALHLLVGIGVVMIMILLVARRTAARAMTMVEVAALYWHFVDMVWVFVYPMLYLVGR